MINNNVIAEIFINQYYRGRIEQFEPIVGDDFTYENSEVGPMPFDQFVKYANFKYANCKSYIKDVTKMGTNVYVVNYAIEVLLKMRQHKCFKSQAMLKINDNIVERAVVEHHYDQEIDRFNHDDFVGTQTPKTISVANDDDQNQCFL